MKRPPIGRKKATLAAMSTAALLLVGIGCGGASPSERRYIFIDGGAHKGEVIALFQTTKLYSEYPWEIYAIEANPNLIEGLYAALNKTEDVYVATLDPASGKVIAPPKPFRESFVGANSAPDWSPDGRYLAYISQGGRGSQGRSAIVVRSLETGKEREFLPDFNPRHPLRPNALRWSPDGRFILFRGIQPGSPGGLGLGREALFRLNVETGEVAPLVLAPRNERRLGWQFPWSPDGKAFYFVPFDWTTNSTHLLRRDLETGQETQLHEGPVFTFGPSLAISPDGRRLAFPFGVPGGGDPDEDAAGLKVISTAGGEPRELLRVQKPHGIYWRVLTWTLDGRYVIFGKGKDGQEKVELWRIPVQEGEPQKVGLEIDRSTVDLRFHCDGRRVAFSAKREIDPRGENITIIDQAISTEEGSVEFFLGEPSRISSMYSTGGYKFKPEAIRVKSFDFSQWIGTNFSLNDYVILSFNIQGAEYPVLEKMLADSTMQTIDRAYISLHPQIAGRTRAEDLELVQKIIEAGVFVANVASRSNRSAQAAIAYGGWIDTLLDPPTIEVHGVDPVEVGARVPLKADVAAHGGTRVEKVEFVVDDSVVGVDKEAPYEVTWTAAGTGRHIFSATAHDSEGNVALSAPVDVLVGTRGERYIMRSADDAEERPDGSMYLTSSDLELIEDPGRGGGEQVVGMRFTDIQIPSGTEIEKAYLQFTVEDVSTEPTELMIQAELTADARPFGYSARDISSRPGTAPSVRWSPQPWMVIGERGEHQRTPDLSALIQEVVALPGWREGNALALIISGSGRRVAESYDGDPSAAPVFYIELAEDDTLSPGR